LAVELASRLAEYVLSTDYSKFDALTLKESKARVIDALGCAVGASDETPVVIARRTVERAGGGPSSLIGTPSTAQADLATFVNGLMVRYFDFNDTYLSKEPAHPSDNLAPCLAVAESEGLGGREFMTALVAAYEVQCRLCDAADIRHRGWDHVNYGLVSVALAASKLMGLSLGQSANSVNIALNAHIAMRQVRAGELSMWKGASFANAARNAVFAANLAREGMTGPAPIFEGEMGFFRQVSGPFELDIEAFGGRGGEFRLPGTYVKYWPAEYHAQSAIWAALELKKKLKSPEEVESVLVQTHEAGFTILAKDDEKWEPKTRETADHSLPWIVGMALLRGEVGVSSYSEVNLRDKSNLSFVRKIRVEEDSRLTGMYPAAGMPNRVSAVTKGGKEIAAEVDLPKGHPGNPMTKEDIESKFLGLTRNRLGAVQAGDVLRTLWKLEDVKDVAEVLELLRPSEPAKA
jgi:2-methylcitrate dehydratase